MMVSELIRELQHMPQDAEVTIEDALLGYNEVRDVLAPIGHYDRIEEAVVLTLGPVL